MKRPGRKVNLLAAIRKCNAADFDGHTEIRKLNPEQKLAWLSYAAQFRFVIRKRESPIVATDK